MKALLVNSLEQKEEAYELARRGLKLNLKSHVCWHVLGLLYRSDRNYVEALKCYKSALRMDPGNAQILRDLSVLQLHQRDVSGYTETRRQLLAAKPGQKQNWLAFAVAEHLRGEPSLALDVLDKMGDSFQGNEEPMGRYEESELLLYKAYLSAEGGDVQRALQILESKEIIDVVGKLEMELYLQMTLGALESCKVALKQLLRVNPSHEGYLLCLLGVCGVIQPCLAAENAKKWLRFDQSGFEMSLDWVSESDRVEILVGGKRRIKYLKSAPCIVLKDLQSPLASQELPETLSQIKAEYLGGAETRSDQFDLICLLLLQHDSSEFRSKLSVFLEAKLKKGVPTAFKMLRGLYIQSPEKGKVVESVLNHFTSLETSDPSFTTYALMSLAHHLDFVGEFSLAVEKLDQALALDSTLVDLYVLKAKVQKHLGDKQGASDTWETARNLDLADRYLNCKSVKALLRVGEISKAKEIVALFSKDSQNSSKSNLTEMQCMWWEFELGNALAAAGEKDAALKVWMDTKKHFDDMTEDEFDFAFYCLRKMTLRAYVDFLKLQDRLKNHKYYTRIVSAIAAHE